VSWYASALLAAMCWGFAPFFEKAGLRGTADSTIGVFVRSLGVVIGTLAAIPFFSRLGPRLSEIPPRNLAYLAMGGILASVVGQAFFYRALKYGELSRATAIGASYPVVACLLGWIIFKEPLTLNKACGVALVTVGILLLKR
jgi:transporter family protein